MEKNKLLTFVLQAFIIFVLGFVFIKAVGWFPLSANVVATQKEEFTSTGTGEVSVVPDTAVVSVGVTSQGSTVKEAQDLLNQNINKVIEAEKALGIPAEDIKTTNYSVNPRYDFSEGKQTIIGYEASSNVTIKVKDSTKVNEVVDTATSNGANQVGGISFEVSDPTAAENEARALAVEEAKKKAQEAANAAGFTLGRIINYTETSNDNAPVPMRYAADSASGIELAPTKIEAGSNEVSVTVRLSYEIL